MPARPCTSCITVQPRDREERIMYLRKRNGERGAALVEFAIGGLVFFTALFGVLEMGRFFWTHAALRDATRKGARYATVRKNDAAGILAVKYMVVYGDPN